MDEIALMNLCLEKIERKVNWGKKEKWTDRHFKKLSVSIRGESSIDISPHTLKRIFGKVKYKSKYNPQSATKDALAIFIGYDSWDSFNFEQALENEIEHQSGHSEMNDSPKLSYSKIAFIGVLAVVFVIGTFWITKNKKVNSDDYTFEINNNIGKAPHTVRINHDFSAINSNNIVIDFDHFSNNGKYLLMQISNKVGNISQCFHFPGQYDIRFFVNEKLVESYPVLIESDGWFTYAVDATPENLDIPEMVRKVIFQRYYRIKFNNIISNTVIDNGVMHVPDTAIQKIPELSTNYKTHHVFSRQIPASLDSCLFEIRFKDEKFGVGLQCREASFEVMGSKGSIQFQVVEPGCSNYAYFRIGKNSIFGRNEAMTDFEVDFSDYVIIQMKVENNQVMLFNNNKHFHSAEYENELGNIHGIHFSGKGSLTVDRVSIQDHEGKYAFYDDFETPN